MNKKLVLPGFGLFGGAAFDIYNWQWLLDQINASYRSIDQIGQVNPMYLGLGKILATGLCLSLVPITLAVLLWGIQAAIQAAIEAVISPHN